MKLDTFFKKFDLFADVPGAVAKFRELILDFAAQGTLTNRQAGDGFAADIVRLVAKERERLVARKEIRKQAALPDLNLETVPFSVPTTWTWVRLGNCVPAYTDDFVDGPFGSNLKAEEYRESGVPIVRLKNIGRNVFKSKDIKFVSTEKAEELKRHSFKPGDLLLNKLGEPVGKCCIAPSKLGTGIIVADVIRLRLPDSKFDTRYVSLVINAPAIARQFLAEITGITRDRVNLAKVRNLPIPLPPLAEQKRIVAKVDELMALCDRLGAQQQERETRHAALARASLARFAETPTAANLQYLFHEPVPIPPADLRKAILTLAVNGQLLGTAHERPANKTRFGKVVNLLGGYAFKSEWFTNSSGVRLVRNQNISHGELNWSDTEYLPRERVQEFEKWMLRPGDLVLSLNRPFISTGLKLAWIREADCPCLLVQRIVCLRPDPEQLLAEYLYLWCNAPHFYRDAHIVPSSGVPYIAPPRVAMMEMSLPPLAEQRRIVAKVEQLMALVDALETQLAVSHATAGKLLSALVAKLTGTPSNGKVSKPAGTGRRGRPRKSPN